MMRALTKKQEAFALGYIKTGNASEAYRNAYDAKGSKPETINVRASELLKNSKVAARVEELRAPALEAAKIDIDRWAQETGKYAFGEPDKNLKHADKRGYLDMMGRHVGAYKEDNLQQRESLVLTVEQARPVKR